MASGCQRRPRYRPSPLSRGDSNIQTGALRTRKPGTMLPKDRASGLGLPKSKTGIVRFVGGQMAWRDRKGLLSLSSHWHGNCYVILTWCFKHSAEAAAGTGVTQRSQPVRTATLREQTRGTIGTDSRQSDSLWKSLGADGATRACSVVQREQMQPDGAGSDV